MAADLVQIHEKYQQRGVVFVGLVNCDQAGAQAIVDRHHIPYRFGYSADMAIRNLIRGKGAPTVFVVGRDGRIVWNDDCARLFHRLDYVVEELETQIDKALAEEH